MYCVVQSKYGTCTTVSKQDLSYPEIIQSGNYTEVFTGTKRQCDQWIDDNAPTQEQD